jgi:hypothetical protein
VVGDEEPETWKVGLLKPLAGLGSQSMHLQVLTDKTGDVFRLLVRYFS